VFLQLKNQTSKIVREVREEESEYVVTHQGQPVAVLSPYTEVVAEKEKQLEREATLRAMKELANYVARSWTSPKSAVELLTEQRC
jgi:prevent-host-death family protein